MTDAANDLRTRRWVDLAVGVGGSAVAFALLLNQDSGDPGRPWLGWLAVALVLAAYVLIARPALVTPSPWRYPAFLVACGGAMALATFAAPLLAMLQTLAYPLVWLVGDTRRRGILGSVVISGAVFLGFAAGEGFSREALLSAAMTAVISLVFAVWLGVWISSIAEYGDERARLLAELTAAQDEVTALSAERGAAGERERLAREIHDTLAQTLAGLVLLTERAGRQSRDGQVDAAAATIATAEGIARDALDETRALVARTAAVPDERALGAAVARLVERFRAETGLSIALHAADDDLPLHRETQVVLLRCLQEALANVRKHAGAQRVDVEITGAGDAATLTVRDDGRGFDPDLARTGFGLDGMRDRLALAGGTMQIDSDASGTRLRVRVPIAAEVSP